jgi:hypothetical protein
MAKRRHPARPSPADEAQIRAVLDLDLARENELIRERALEIVAECGGGDLERRVAELDAEAWRLVDAFEGNPSMDEAPSPGDARTAAAVARQCRNLVARIDALVREG